MNPVDLFRLSPLMERTQGRCEIAIALVDRPVVLDRSDWVGSTIRGIPEKLKGTCRLSGRFAYRYAMVAAGMY